MPHRLFVIAMSLLITALLFDLVDLGTGTGALALPAYWLGAAGVVGGIAAGGWRLWRLAPTGAAASLWRLTALPGFFKAAAIGLFAGGWSLRTLEGDVPSAAMALAAIGVALVMLAPLLRARAAVRREPAPCDAPAAAETAPAAGSVPGRTLPGSPAAGSS